MKVIDAIWERRNLGVTCAEVAIETTDTVESIRDQLSRSDAQYIVVKLPAGRADVMFALTELGFTFLEALINVTWKVGAVALPKIQQRIADGTGHALMNDADKEALWRELRNGIHDSDRVAVDPHFGKQRAGERYVGWIQDELARGTELYKMTYKGASIGYFTLKHLGDGIYYPFLAGMYESHRTSGMGVLVPYKPMSEVAARGGKMISTFISTNNEPAIRMHVSLGFNFGQVTYVYVKHN